MDELRDPRKTFGEALVEAGIEYGRPMLDLDEASARAWVADLGPDLVINCAAYTAVDQAESDVDEALRMVKALQFFETNGEVCPANWQEGARTIKPSPDDSKEFFGAEYADQQQRHQVLPGLERSGQHTVAARSHLEDLLGEIDRGVALAQRHEGSDLEGAQGNAVR